MAAAVGAGRRPCACGERPSCRMEKADVWTQGHYAEATVTAGLEEGKPSRDSCK